MTLLPGVRVNGEDDVTIGLLNRGIHLVFFYADGNYEEYITKIKAHSPEAICIPIAVRSDFVIKGALRLYLDVERGDATNEEALGWYHLAKKNDVELPGFYTSVSNAQALIDTLKSAGVILGTHYLLWTAHYTGRSHLCSPECGFDFTETANVTQWTDTAEGKSLDGDLATAWAIGMSSNPSDHYDWYPNFRIKHLGNRTEREIVEDYDKTRASKIPHPDALHVLKELCGQAATRIATLAEEELSNGKPSYGLYHRGWRKELLLKRHAGDKVAI
jgi:hypothetical protein